MATKDKAQKKAKLRHAEYYDFQKIQDKMYSDSLRGREFKNLVEIIALPENIRLAYRNIKANHGSRTAGTDGRTIKDLESLSDEKLIALVQRKLNWYIPQSVRRVEIPKGNDPSKKRPLGIPTILDRLIQQCVLQVLEPICEAKFHDHSFGFRPNRSQEHAIALVYKNIQLSHYCYVVDIDIKGFFDGLVLPGADILRDAGFDVAGQQHLGKAVQRRARRRTLRQNIGTISVLFNHAANPANLPLDAAEPVEQIALLFVIPMLCSAMTAAGHHLVTHACSPRLREHYIPRGGILSRKIPK